MSWSEAQQRAIDTRGCNILVAAAAGSGKTSVLVERIVQRLLDAAEPIDVDRLLVVTFTSAAAAEMRERIGGALQRVLQERGADPHIERQLALLGSSSISTLHSFCQSVIRQHFHRIDLDPAFRVGSEAEMELLRQDVLDELCEDRYANSDEGFLRLVEHYGGERDDAQLTQLLLDLYEFSRSHPQPERWLAELPRTFQIEQGQSVDDTPWGELLRGKVRLELGALRESCAALADEPQLPDPYVRVLEDDGKALAELAAALDSWRSLEDGLKAIAFGRLPSVKDADDDVKKSVQQQRKRCKDKVDEWRNQLCARSESELLDDLTLVEPQVAALAQLAVDFSAAFSRMKREKALVDFSDLEHLCLAVLRKNSEEPTTPSEVAKALQGKYVEIMIDEYQDTNGVQEAILQLLVRRDRPNLFAVGDVKQSIYRFRLAEPELFLEKYRGYPTRADACRIDLAQNFRSRDGVLAVVNQVFSQLLTPTVTELEYGPAEHLNPGANYPPPPGEGLAGPVEVLLLDRDAETAAAPDDDSAFAAEARAIARRILELLSEERWVFDKEAKEYRRLTWRDIVVLLRSVRGKADVLQETLRASGIPVYADQAGGYFAEPEIKIMLALLQVIDNPRQDIELAAVLRSPLGGFAADELARIRLLEPADDLWTALQTAAASDDAELAKRVRCFSDQLDAWRDLARRRGVPDLIWQIYRDSGYYELVAGMPGGALRQANLRALYDRARQYEATNFRGLFRFLRFIQRMQDGGADLAVARTLGEGENVVRVMSIHKSKGLEFPVVIVADLGKPFNLMDARQTVLCHKKLGVGPFVTQPELRYKYSNLARLAIAHQLVMETKAEELRILYVAMTRAREKLIMFGSLKKLNERMDVWCRQGRHAGVLLSDGVLAGAGCFLDWLGPVLSRRQGTLKSFADEQWRLSLPEAATAEADNRSEAVDSLAAIAAAEALEPGGFGEQVTAALEWKYPLREVVDIPAKLSVTEIKRRFDLEQQADGRTLFGSRGSAARRPSFVRAERAMTAVEYGVMMHGIMQNMRLQPDLDEAAVRAQLREMAACQLLDEKAAAELDAASVAAFFAAPLGKRLLAADHVEREMPFSIMLPAQRFYPELVTADETIFVQGVVDALFWEQDGWVLVDYKTDRGLSGVALQEKYELQLSLYAEAISAILRQPVKESYLYSFAGREIIRCGKCQA